MECCTTFSGYGYHANYCNNTPLAPWEKELLMGTDNLRSDVEFFLKDGTSFIIEDVEVDSIGDNGEGKGITAVESNKTDNTFHIPNVLYWTYHHNYVSA